jgi:TonB family protein
MTCTMRLTPLLALALALGPVPALARQADAAPLPALESLMSLQVEGEVDIDAAGNVVAFRFDAPPPASLRPSLERTVQGWKFVAEDADAPMKAQTIDMHIAVAARESAGAYLARIDNVRLSAKAPDGKPLRGYETDTVAVQSRSMRAPAYPSALNQLEIEGKVLVAVLLDPDGSVADAAVVQSAVLDAREQSDGLRRAMQWFEASALAAAKRWRFDVTPLAGVPTPKDLTLFVPVNYGMWGKRNEPERWRPIVRTEHTPPPWLPATDVRSRLGVADVGGGGAVPAAPDVRFAKDPAGSAL